MLNKYKAHVDRLIDAGIALIIVLAVFNFITPSISHVYRELFPEKPPVNVKLLKIAPHYEGDKHAKVEFVREVSTDFVVNWSVDTINIHKNMDVRNCAGSGKSQLRTDEPLSKVYDFYYTPASFSWTGSNKCTNLEPGQYISYVVYQTTRLKDNYKQTQKFSTAIYTVCPKDFHTNETYLNDIRFNDCKGLKPYEQIATIKNNT